MYFWSSQISKLVERSSALHTCDKHLSLSCALWFLPWALVPCNEIAATWPDLGEWQWAVPHQILVVPPGHPFSVDFVPGLLSSSPFPAPRKVTRGGKAA